MASNPKTHNIKIKTMNQKKKKKTKKKRKEKAFNHRVSSCFLNRKVQNIENLKLKKKKSKSLKLPLRENSKEGTTKVQIQLNFQK